MSKLVNANTPTFLFFLFMKEYIGQINYCTDDQYCHVHAKKQMIACQCIQAQRIHEQLQTANEPFISISAIVRHILRLDKLVP